MYQRAWSLTHSASNDCCLLPSLSRHGGHGLLIITALLLVVTLGQRIPGMVLLIKGLRSLFVHHSFPPLCNTPSLSGQCPFRLCGSGEATDSVPQQAWAITISICLAFLVGAKGGPMRICILILAGWSSLPFGAGM